MPTADQLNPSPSNQESLSQGSLLQSPCHASVTCCGTSREPLSPLSTHLIHHVAVA